MIEFRGELSNKSKKCIQTIGTKGASILSMIITIVIAGVLIFVGYQWKWIITSFIIVPVLMTIMASIPQINSPIKTLNLYLPKKLIIENETICIEGERISEIRSVSDVKKVIDMDELYHIIFNFPYKSIYFICQKNLIVKGTIEDFEKLFEGKIVRKN